MVAHTREFKVLQLPSKCEANAQYFVKYGSGARHYITDALGQPLQVGGLEAHTHTIDEIVGLQDELDARIAEVINSAPAALDTLGEIAAQLANDESVAAALATTVAGKENSGVAASLIAAAVGSITQAWSATLDGLSALSPTAFGKSLLELASAAALRTAIALPTTTTVGRLARYTDTAGAIGSTAGLYEDNAGNVGMGTASPEAALHVANGGKIVLDGGLGGTMRGIIKHAADIYNPSSDAIYITPGDGAGRRIFLGESGKPFYALNLGYVSNIEMMPPFAVGTNPVQVGSAGTTAIFRNDNYPFAGVYGLVSMSGRPATGSDVVDFAWVSADQYYPGNVAGYAQRMVLTRAGNLGLGVSAPAVKLDVDGPIKVKTYTVATAPSAAVAAGQIIYVSDESSGATLAFSDGTDWRRASDRAVIS